jgi:hypothetical protein
MEVRRVRRTRRSIPQTLPAPVGGLNGRSGLANMEPTDAFVLDNWIPGNSTVDTRKGCEDHVTGIPTAVETLAQYAGGSSQKLLAFAGGSVYDVTSPGVVGAAIASGKSGNQVQTTMFSNAGAQLLIGCSGQDAPFSYNGTTYTTLAYTGVTGSANTFVVPFSFKGRLYFAQAGMLGFYYLAVGAIQGAASYFDLSQVAQRGGNIVGIASVSSSNAGSGPQDYIIFMTSEGEYIVYSGFDPSNAANWALVGRYYSSPPLGYKAYFNFRSDLFIIAEDGVIPFSVISAVGEARDPLQYLSSKLGRYYTGLNIFKDTYGWSAISCPEDQMLLVNCPTSGSIAGQYVQFSMNTSTNAWARFTGWNAICWALFDRKPYYGTADGRIVRANAGQTDSGQDIPCAARQAYNYFDDGRGMGAADKQFHFATFIFESDGTPPVSANLNVNFDNIEPDYVSVVPINTGAAWDDEFWDTVLWAGEGTSQIFTIPFGNIGYAASVWLKALNGNVPLKWYATRLVMEKTGGIVLV